MLPYCHIPILQGRRERLVRRSWTVFTVGTTLVASASSVPAVCVEGKTSLPVSYCVMTVTRLSTSGASHHHWSRSPRKTSG